MLDEQMSGKNVIKGGILHELCDGHDLLVIPKDVQTEVIREAHNIGHFGEAKTELLLRREFSIIG